MSRVVVAGKRRRIMGVLLLLSIVVAFALVPQTAMAGANQWTTTGPYGAYTYALAVSPAYANDQTLFAGTYSNGVYKSVDGGVTWSLASTGITDLYIRALALSPGYQTDQTVFAGGSTGGVFKSTDGGATWSAVNGGTLDKRIYGLTLSPNYATDQTIYAGTENGVYKSVNGGASWSFVYNPGAAVYSIALSPVFSTDQTIYLGTNGYGVRKSTNAGANWTAVNSGITNLRIFAVALSPNFAADGTLFAASLGGGVFRSTNGGAAWSAVNTGLTNQTVYAFAISPGYAADQMIYAGTTSGVFKSTDRGAAWSAINTGITDLNIRALATSPAHATDHILFAGSSTGGGVHKSTDRGANWVRTAAGLTNLHVYSLASSPDYATDRTILAGTNGGAGIYRSTDGGVSWSDSGAGITNSPVHAIAFSPDYAYDRTVFAGTNGGGVFKSTDGGVTWTSTNTGLTGLFVYGVTISPAYVSDQTVFAATSSAGVFRSTDGGATWSAVNAGSGTATMKALAISPDFANDRTVFAGSFGNGALYRSTDGGSNWSTVLANVEAMALAVSPDYAADRTIYAGNSNGIILKSIDNGLSWTLSNTGLGSQTVRSMHLSPAYGSDHTVYAATDNGGIYKSVNDGGSWSAMNTGLANLSAFAVMVPPTYASDQTVFAGVRSSVYGYQNTLPTTLASAAGYRFGTWTALGTVAVSLSATDRSGTGIAAGYPRVCIDSSGTCTPTSAYAGPLTVTCAAGSSCVQYVRFYSADNGGGIEPVVSMAVRQDAAAPVTTASPAGGSYTAPQNVVLTCLDVAGSGCAETYYSVDGSEPTQSSARYTGPITIDGTATLKFRSIDAAGNLEQRVASEVYSLVAASATLAASPAGAQVVGTPLTFTAQGNGGSGTYEYRFYRKLSTDAKWTLVRDYASPNTWTWDTAGATPGVYTVKVSVRCAGSTASQEAYATASCSLVTEAPATGAALSASPTGVQMIGTPLIFTASGSGGSGTYEYQFLYKLSTDAKWTVGRPYDPQNAWTWDTTGIAAGVYSVKVMVRNAGSAASMEASATIAAVLVTEAPATAATLVSDLRSPQPMGTSILFTAAGAGGSGSYEYRFQLKGPGATVWTTMQQYSSLNTWLWDTSSGEPGLYTIMVQVRNTGSAASSETSKSMGYLLMLLPPATGVDLTTTSTSPTMRGQIGFTAAAQGGTGAYEYRFLVKHSAAADWTVAREYDPNGFWTWDAVDALQWPAGRYSIQVQARSAGNSTSADVSKTVYLVIADMPPATLLTLASERPSPLMQGQTVIFTAQAYGNGPSGFEYQFRVKDAAGAIVYSYPEPGSWMALGQGQPFSNWYASPAGTYTIQVLARAIGSGTEYDVMQSLPFTWTELEPAKALTLETNVASPVLWPQAVNFTAQAYGGNSCDYEYGYIVKDSSGATIVPQQGTMEWQRYCTLTTLSWTPDQPGTYTVQVLARTPGRQPGDNGYDVTRSMVFTWSQVRPATSLSLSADLPSPWNRFLGTPLISAQAHGGDGTYEYRFVVKDSAGKVVPSSDPFQNGWVNLGPEMAVLALDPGKPGNYTILAMARSVGSGTAYDVKETLSFTLTDYDPARSVVLTANMLGPSPAPPQQVGFWAQATGSTGPYEYKYQVVDGSGTVVYPLPGAEHPWSLESGLFWGPQSAGRFVIQVKARVQFGGREIGDDSFDVSDAMEFTWSNNGPVKSVSIWADQPSPRSRGYGSTTFGAQAWSDNGSSFEYRFLLKDSTGVTIDPVPNWDIPWKTDAGFSWTPPKAGTYTIIVMARTLSGLSSYDPFSEASDSLEFTWTDSEPARSVSMVPDRPSPQRMTEGPVNFAAVATGSMTGYEFRYQVLDSTGAVVYTSVDQPSNPWTTNNSFSWKPARAGKYALQVFARSMGGRLAEDANYDVTSATSFTWTDIDPATSLVLTSDLAGPVSYNRPVQFTAQASSPYTSSFEYRFVVKDAKGNVVYDSQQGPGIWSATNTIIWSPVAWEQAGQYTITAYTRGIGNPQQYDDSYDVSKSLSFTWTRNENLKRIALTADRVSPVSYGYQVLFKAEPYPDWGGYEYRFVVTDSKGNVVHAPQPSWSGTSTLSWSPWKAGTYRVQVFARQYSSWLPGDDTYEAADFLEFTWANNDEPVMRVSLTADQASPVASSSLVTFTAQPFGSAYGYAEYRFLVKDAEGRLYYDSASNYPSDMPFSPTNTFSWSAWRAGTYSIEVQARSGWRPLNDASYDVSEAISFTWSGSSEPATGVSLIPNYPSPHYRYGEAVTFTAQASGSSANAYEYRFIARDSAGAVAAVMPMQGWSGTNAFIWSPGKYGNYSVQVLARSAGRQPSDDSYDVSRTLSYTWSDMEPATSLRLIPDLPSPQLRQGPVVTFTAHASGGIGGYDYRFIVKDSEGNVVYQRTYYLPYEREWVPWNTFAFTPSKAGRYSIQVFVRTVSPAYENDSRYYDVTATTTFVWSDEEPATMLSLSANRPSPWNRSDGNGEGMVSFVAEALGGWGSYEYRFEVRDSSGTVMFAAPADYPGWGSHWQDWNSLGWVPSRAGTYTVQAFARTLGSRQFNDPNYDVTSSMSFTWSEVTPATSVSLMADRPSPWIRSQGPVTLTAQAAGGAGNYEYQFSVRDSAGNIVSGIPAANSWAGNVLTWSPAQPGNYLVRVLARSMGSGTDYDALSEMPFVISDAAPTTAVTLSSDVPSPAQRGVITFTAAAQGGSGSYEYRYLVRSAKTLAWTTVRDYGADPSFFWYPYDYNQWPAGSCLVRVQARSVGSGTEYDVLTDMPFIIADNVPVTSVSLSSPVQSPAQRGSIQFAANAQGGTGPAEYLFIVKHAASGRQVATSAFYQQNGTWYWDTSSAAATPDGTYAVQVLARNSDGSGTEYDAMDAKEYVIYSITPAASVALSIDQPSPVLRAVGNVTLTATAQGGEGGYEYRFLVKSSTDVRWTVLQEYLGGQSSVLWSVTNMPPGRYTVKAMVRSWGNRTEYDAVATSEIIIANVLPAASVDLGADRAMPVLRSIGNMTFTAAAQGGTGTYEYQFLIKRDGDARWVLLQDYKVNPTFTWDFLNSAWWPAGTYTVQVQARSLGSGMPFDASATMAVALSETTPAEAVAVTVNPSGAQIIGTPILFTAAGSGGSGTYEYKYLYKLSTDTKWSLGRDYELQNAWTLETAGRLAGVYTVKVMVRNAGSVAGVEAYVTASCSLVESAPATGATITALLRGPQPAGILVPLTATGQGGSGTYEYKYLYKLSTDTKWTIGREYSTDAAWNWDTTGLTAGTYTVKVMVRNAGSAAALEAYKTLGYGIQ
ncbi:MAG: chitobiase/beta-hexosaminidase C-terminal domain-containing protein [Nitrospirota bacterium]|nr:chitobiase/beta-hexosaminidase C-terminal domain-containing protein [Nitrospirota bacterium]